MSCLEVGCRFVEQKQSKPATPAKTRREKGQDIPESVRTKVDDLKKKIISGELKVWNVIDQGYPTWLKG